MGLAKLKQDQYESDDLSEEALAIIDHIGQILAQEFVELMKSEEKEDESSDLRKVLK
ncbi:MAG: hypothetical protein R3A13_01395 [Bdellovibrionota bacterium]